MLIDQHSDVPIYQQIYQKIHDGIEDGSYPMGSKLPSIRGLADDLGCSHNTVETAYHLLTSEGLVASRPGSGYVVQDVSFLEMDAPRRPAPDAAPTRRIRYDFTYGDLEPGSFPAAAWRAITDDILLSVENVGCDAYNDPLGEEELRGEIAWRLNTQRGLHCTSEQVVIQGGTHSSVQNLLALFPGDTVVAMEEPGYDGVRSAIERARVAVAPCRIDRGYERFLADLDASGAHLVYVTPSSQFPTCQVMPVDLRERLLAWARDHDAYILEDDYCRDFRYRERALLPLANIDLEGRVVYMGTFSKSLSPALRMNYLVLPPRLLEQWRATFGRSYAEVPWLNQAVLGRFMRDGWNRHLRRAQVRNRRKYETLTGSLRAVLGDRVKILENGTGLHLLVNVPGGRSQDELIEAAEREGVAVYGTKRYWANTANAPEGCVLVGFSAIPEGDIEPGVRALARAWFGD